MKRTMRNIPNVITLLRIILVFGAIGLLSHSDAGMRMWGVVFLILAFLLDGIDGYTSRILDVDNKVGALLDILGDRITENALLIFLAYKNLIPLFIPLVFISRSFVADFIRSLAFQRGIGTFSLSTSLLGRCLVASRISRAVYLILKFALFALGAFMLVYPEVGICREILPRVMVRTAILVLLLNVLRFIGLLWDSRNILKETFAS